MDFKKIDLDWLRSYHDYISLILVALGYFRYN